MVEQNLLDAPQFTISLNANTSALNAGQIIFGGNDSSLYTGALTSYPVLSPSCAPTFWLVLVLSCRLPARPCRGSVTSLAASCSLATQWLGCRSAAQAAAKLRCCCLLTLLLLPADWVIGLNGSAVGSTNVPLQAQAAVIDLGTTGIVMSDADAGNISAVRHALLPVAMWPYQSTTWQLSTQ